MSVITNNKTKLTTGKFKPNNFDLIIVLKVNIATDKLVTSSGEMGEENCKQDGIGQPPSLVFYKLL